MARKIKHIFTENGTDRRETGYYSTPEPVAQYIFKRLREINPNGMSVIDTCVGMEELANPFIESGMQVTGIDIFDHGGEKKAAFIQKDFIELYEQGKTHSFSNNSSYNFSNIDYWIANPPYNCHENKYIKSNKSHLKKVFSDVGVHNMYSMFMSAMLDLAKDGAILGFITLDSFLTSIAHKELRDKLINNFTIHDILLCPTDLFLDQGAEVRTCIFIIQKGKSNLQPKLKLLNRPLNKLDFYKRLNQRNFDESRLENILLDSDIDNQELLIGVPEDIREMFKGDRLGNKFRCITGISTGNDSKYISKEKKDGFTVPFYKNPGSRKFFCKPDGFLIDSFLNENKAVKNFMVRNISMLYKPGITCSSMGVEFSACYLQPHSTFGVNPNIICDENDTWWLLAYLNSNIAKYIVRGILIRSNMVTSGYVSRLPIPYLTGTNKKELSALAKKGFIAAQNNPHNISDLIKQINKKLYEIIGLSENIRKMLDEFSENIIKRT